MMLGDGARVLLCPCLGEGVKLVEHAAVVIAFTITIELLGSIAEELEAAPPVSRAFW